MDGTQELKTGDIVQLKSGGFEMTVKETSNGDVSCQWCSGKKLESGVFPPEMLVRHDLEVKRVLLMDGPSYLERMREGQE